MKKTCIRVSFSVKLQTSGLKLCYKSYSGTVVFLWILRNSLEQLFNRTPPVAASHAKNCSLWKDHQNYLTIVYVTPFQQKLKLPNLLRKKTWRYRVENKLKCSDNFKDKQKRYEVTIFDSKSIYTLKVYPIFYALRLNTNVTKISLGQNKP